MIIMATSFTTALTILVFCLLPVSYAGSFCVDSYGDTEYCYYGCCLDDTCCPGVSIGLIAGLSCGGVGLLIGLLVLILCIRRRRRYGGVIYTNQAPNSTVFSSQSNHNMVSATGASQQQFAASQGYANPGYGPAPPYAPSPAYGPKY